MPIPRDLVAASATPLVLTILSRGDSYGYDIIRQVRESSDGAMQWADGMLYPILHRLEKKGLVKSYWGQAETGRKRKYYRLRKAGRTKLGELRKTWDEVHALLQRLGGPQTCSN